MAVWVWSVPSTNTSCPSRLKRQILFFKGTLANSCYLTHQLLLGKITFLVWSQSLSYHGNEHPIRTQVSTLNPARHRLNLSSMLLHPRSTGYANHPPSNGHEKKKQQRMKRTRSMAMAVRMAMATLLRRR